MSRRPTGPFLSATATTVAVATVPANASAVIVRLAGKRVQCLASLQGVVHGDAVVQLRKNQRQRPPSEDGQ